MTTSGLPRRAVVGAVLAASLVGAGVTAFAADSGCPAWTDPAGDATTGGEPTGVFSDDQMDIVGASLATVDGKVVATIKSAALGDTASDFGDEFRITMTIGGKEIQIYSDRGPSAGDPLTSPVGFDAGFYNVTDDTSGAATSTYDTKASTVTITGTVAELSKALGSAAAGKTASALVASTQDYAPGTGAGFGYDDAETKATYAVGAACGGSGAPAPTATASAAPTSAPATPPAAAGAAGLPAADCFVAKDPKADAHPLNAKAPADPDLDLTGLTFQTTANALIAYAKVDKLGAGPSQSTDGHRFTFYFTHNKHVFALAGSAYKNAQNAQVKNGLASTGQFSHVTQLSVDGPALTDPNSRTNPGFVDSGLTFTFDQKNSYVIASLPIKDIEKYGKAPFAGATVTGVYTTSATDTDVISSQADVLPDDAPTTTPSKLTYTAGDNHCFAPPAPPLSSVGALKAQYGDTAAVAAKLVDAAGAPVAGKAVTFTLGASRATATTGADGVAKAGLVVKDKAGRRTLNLTSGDAKATAPFTVLLEKTSLKASGSKGAVTATLADDDRKPVAGQVISFVSGSKKVTAKTNAKGVATVKGFTPGSTVTVTYAGVSGAYAGARTTAKA